MKVAEQIPRVSVVMAVHNGERFLREAVDSILTQTVRDFEFLIVDDASSDGTPAILADYAKADGRIRLLRNDTNLGPYPSANRALELARAPIIARMDADDISAPQRLERQLAFLDANPDHMLVGSGYRAIDEHGRLRYRKRNGLDDARLRWISRFRMPMVHPSFCFRARHPEGSPVRYGDGSEVALDYALAADLLARGKAASLDEMLVDYRMHQSNISSTRRVLQNTMAIRTARRVLAMLDSEDSADAFAPFLETLYGFRAADGEAFAASVQSFQEAIARAGSRREADWMTLRAAGMLAEAFIGGKGPSGKLKWGVIYAVKAPGLIVPLIRRTLEARGWTGTRTSRARPG